MANKRSDYNDVLFGYMCTPSYGYHGKDDGGFSVELYANGRVVHKTYIFSEIEKTKTEYKISNDSVLTIRAIMEKYLADINAFSERLDNGSCDGNGNFFIFFGKQIVTWNIKYTDEDELQARNPNYYEKYLPVVKQENKILLIFEKIINILEEQGIYLKLRDVRFNEKVTLREEN